MLRSLRLTAARAALSVAAARLRAHPLRPALVIAGVGLAFAMLAAVVGGTLAARQQALAGELGATPVSERAFRVDRFGLPLNAADYSQADRRVRRAIAPLGSGGTRRVVFFRELRVAGQLVELAAVDDLAAVVRLRAGRLPRRCGAARCEVLQIGAGGGPTLAEGDLKLARVGVAELRDPTIFGVLSATAGAGLSHPVVLVAPSVSGLQKLPALGSFYRIYSWLLPLRVDRLRTWQIDRLLAAESRAQSALNGADFAFRLGGPDQVLTDAAGRGSVAARRLILVGGETSALLLGFAIIAAIGLRRGLGSERRRLFARGARRWQVAVATGAELASLTLAGAVSGIAVGAVVVAAIARAADVAPLPILTHALLTPTALLAFATAYAATTVCLLVATLTREDGRGRRRRLGLVDVSAAGAAATVAVGLSRGALDPEAVSANGVLLLLLPALIAFVAAVILARLLTPAMRAAERLTRRRAESLRLAVLALARAPSRTVVSCAFVAVALGLALFAASYRATLSRGASDQAAFQVPLDFTLSEGARLVLPLDAAPLERYRAFASGAYPVLRLGATTPGLGSAVLSPTVLGLPKPAIAHLRWRSDYSPLSTPAIARALAPRGEAQPSTVALPAGTLTLRVRLRGSDVVVSLVVADSRRRTRFLPLGRVQPGSRALTAQIGQGLALVGLRISLPADEEFFFAHRQTEADVAEPPHGVLALEPLEVRGQQLTAWRHWAFPGGDTKLSGAGIRLGFAFAETGEQLVFRPVEPTDGRAMRAVVSPDIARAAGGVGSEFALDFQEVIVHARVVGVARRLPTVPAASGPFVLADRGWLATAVNADAPGLGTTNEIWLRADQKAAAALRHPPFTSLLVTSRTKIERGLAADPLARATARVLGAAAIVALVLAVLGFWVGILSELSDERSDFFDLEVQGVPPTGLRAQLRTRALILVALGLAGGAALGAILAQLVVAFVRVSANEAVPEPPLRLDPTWLVSGGAVVALALASLLVAELTSLAAFRGRRPERASWSLE